MNIATLFARIGIQADTKKAQNFLDQLKGIKVGLGITTISIAAFSYGIKKLMDDAIQTSFALKQFNAETGLSTDKLQRWQSVADEVNNSGQAVANSIKAIVSNQEKIKLGMGNISGYQLLGIDPRQDPFKILEELRVKTRGLSQGMKKNILEQMGISKELIQVLELSKEKFDAMSKGAFIIPQWAINTIDKARASSKQLGSAVKYLKGMIAANLAPSIIKLNKQIMIWIRNNQQGIIKTIKEIFKWITKFVGAIINAVKMVNEIVTATIGWKNALYLLIGVIAILNSALLLSPLGIFIASLLALIVVLDDLWVYSQGGESVFGDLMKKFPEFEKGLLGFLEKVKQSFGLVKALFKGDETGVEEFIKKMGNLGVGIVAIFEVIRTVFNLAKLNFQLMLRPLQFLINALDTLWKAFNKEITWGEAMKTIGKLFVEHGKETWGDISELGKEAVKSAKVINNAFQTNIEINANGQIDEEKLKDTLIKEMDKRDQQNLNNAEANQ